MTESELKEKYGSETVLCVRLEDISFNKKDGPYFPESKLQCCLAGAEAVPRWKAEADPDYKQLVNYVLLRRFSVNGFFVTGRTGGDDRLVGRSSICVGGHVQEGETLHSAMFRELEEETGVTPDDITVARRIGYIYDDSSEVSSCHFGVVWDVVLKDQCEVSVREPDKMTGQWLDIDDIAALSERGDLESWSEHVYRQLLKRWV